MAERNGTTLERFLIMAMLAAAIASLLSIWSEDWIGVESTTVRYVCGITILVIAVVYFAVRRKRLAGTSRR